MKYGLMLICLLVAGCGYLDKEEPTKEDILDSEMEDLYSERLESTNDWDMGWPDTEDCDGLVWAGVACAAGVKVDLYPAFYKGRFKRRPKHSCYPDDHNGDGRPDSRSTISIDGLVAAMTCMSVNGDIDMAKEMARYGENHNWVYGEPWPEGIAEVYLKPWFQGVLGRLTHEGKSYAKIPLILKYSDKDYVAHIQTLAIWTDMRETGGTSTANIELLSRYHDRDPNDYLIRSVYGLYNNEANSTFTQVRPPSYVRGGSAERFALAHWLLSAKIYLNKGD